MQMKQIIDKIPVSEIIDELKSGYFVRRTTNGSNEIYITNAKQQPGIMKEIGRLREITFRESGGGTGNSSDIDDDDTCENGYQQLIVWDPENNEIVGGYRFMIVDTSVQQHMSTRKYFDFSNCFIEKYYPYTMELGRSFIQPKYQSRSASRKSMFALDNLWDGLGAIMAMNKNIKYLIGKVTMYSHIDSELINMLYSLLAKYFPDEDKMITPKPEVEYIFDKNKYSDEFEGLTYRAAMIKVVKKAREIGEVYPPLFSAYANLSFTMKVFGTVVNSDFGNVYESAIMITIGDMKPAKYDRYVASYSVPED